MRNFIVLFFVLLTVQGFSKETYRVRVKSDENKTYRGQLQSISDSDLKILSANGRTITFKALNIESITVWKKGSGLRSVIIGSAALTLIGIIGFQSSGDLTQEGALLFGTIIGIPSGALAGFALNPLVRRNWKFKSLGADFSQIKNQLSQYIITP